MSSALWCAALSATVYILDYRRRERRAVPALSEFGQGFVNLLIHGCRIGPHKTLPLSVYLLQNFSRPCLQQLNYVFFVCVFKHILEKRLIVKIIISLSGVIITFLHIFFIEFFHIVNYNIENWVWQLARTRTLAALCCMLSGFVSSLEIIGLLG